MAEWTKDAPFLKSGQLSEKEAHLLYDELMNIKCARIELLTSFFDIDTNTSPHAQLQLIDERINPCMHDSRLHKLEISLYSSRFNHLGSQIIIDLSLYFGDLLIDCLPDKQGEWFFYKCKSKYALGKNSPAIKFIKDEQIKIFPFIHALNITAMTASGRNEDGRLSWLSHGQDLIDSAIRKIEEKLNSRANQ